MNISVPRLISCIKRVNTVAFLGNVVTTMVINDVSTIIPSTVVSYSGIIDITIPSLDSGEYLYTINASTINRSVDSRNVAIERTSYSTQIKNGIIIVRESDTVSLDLIEDKLGYLPISTEMSIMYSTIL